MTTHCSTTTTGSNSRTCWLLLILIFVALGAQGYETDQFNNRLEPISDSTDLLNEQVNEALNDIASNWKGRRNDRQFVDKIYRRIGGAHWVDKLEKWAMNSPDVERLSTPRRESIYAGHPVWATRVAAMFGVGPTIKLNDNLVGSDKIGHFLSQGRKFWLRYLQYGDEAEAAKYSAYTERAIFGQMTTGSYSNADLVANFEGYRFYRSLFEDDIIAGKPSILVWGDGHYVMQRPFDWADHVNEYWDEAINVNHYDGLLYEPMKARFLEFCDLYYEYPESFAVSDEDALKNKYKDLELRDTSELRLNNLCEPAEKPVPGNVDTAAMKAQPPAPAH